MPPTKLWFVPEWAPNLHPLLVHFPVALLVTAVVVDALALTQRRHTQFALGAAGLYALGTISLLATYLTGRDAADTVFTPGMAHVVVAEHWTWAMWTLIYFGGLTAVRLVAHRRLERGPTALGGLLVLGGAGGLFLLTETASRGGRLVYEFGVGVIGAP